MNALISKANPITDSAKGSFWRRVVVPCSLEIPWEEKKYITVVRNKIPAKLPSKNFWQLIKTLKKPVGCCISLAAWDRYPKDEPCFWKITSFRWGYSVKSKREGIKDISKQGKAWGVFTWRGVSEGLERPIRSRNKPGWRLSPHLFRARVVSEEGEIISEDLKPTQEEINKRNKERILKQQEMDRRGIDDEYVDERSQLDFATKILYDRPKARSRLQKMRLKFRTLKPANGQLPGRIEEDFGLTLYPKNRTVDFKKITHTYNVTDRHEKDIDIQDF